MTVTEPLNGTENAGPSSYIPQIANKHMDRGSPPRTICHVEHPRVDDERPTMWSDSEWQTPLSSSISRVELSGGRDTSADEACWWWAPGVDAGPPPHARPLYSTIPLPAEDLPCAFDTSELRSTLGTSTKSTMLPPTSASKMSLVPNPIHQPIPRYFSAQAPFSVLHTEPSPCPSPSRRSALLPIGTTLSSHRRRSSPKTGACLRWSRQEEAWKWKSPVKDNIQPHYSSTTKEPKLIPHSVPTRLSHLQQMYEHDLYPQPDPPHHESLYDNTGTSAYRQPRTTNIALPGTFPRRDPRSMRRVSDFGPGYAVQVASRGVDCVEGRDVQARLGFLVRPGGKTAYVHHHVAGGDDIPIIGDEAEDILEVVRCSTCSPDIGQRGW